MSQNIKYFLAVRCCCYGHLFYLDCREGYGCGGSKMCDWCVWPLGGCKSLFCAPGLFTKAVPRELCIREAAKECLPVFLCIRSWQACFFLGLRLFLVSLFVLWLCGCGLAKEHELFLFSSPTWISAIYGVHTLLCIISILSTKIFISPTFFLVIPLVLFA